jgi:hypothetical protein
MLATLACAPPGAGDPCARPGASGCLMDGLDGVFFCDAAGYHEMLCPDGQHCAEGQCRAPSCTANLFYCDHGVAHVCDSTGTIDHVTDCGPGTRCVVGATTAECVASSCMPLTVFCSADGSAVLKCAPDGMSSSTVQTCDDPLERGNACAGGACRDRCALVEANDRSTLGCRFVAAALLGGSPTVHVVNPQPDLPATVTLSRPSGMSSSTTIAPGSSATLAIDAAPDPGSGSQVATRAGALTSTVPVYAWLYEGAGDGLALHPEHALSTSYLAAIDPSGAQQVAVLATANGTHVTVTLPGGGAPSTATLARGQVLTVASASPLGGARVDSSAPVAVEIGAASGEASMPGADTLGLDAVLLHPSLVVARADGTLTGSASGPMSIAAGQPVLIDTPQELHATAPMLVIDQSGGREVVPCVEQWRTAGYTPDGSNSLSLGALQSTTVTVGPAQATLAGSGSFASGATGAVGPAALSASTPFFALTGDGQSLLVPTGYGLASIHP